MAEALTPAVVNAPVQPAPGDWRGRAQALLAQPAVRRSLPALAGMGALAGAGLLYLALADGPQRTLYTALTDAERAEFTALNDAYVARHGFPFIIAVRDYDKAGILDAFRRRINNDRETEFAEAARQVERIAALRLSAILP